MCFLPLTPLSAATPDCFCKQKEKATLVHKFCLGKSLICKTIVLSDTNPKCCRTGNKRKV